MTKPTRDQRQLAYDAVGGLTASEIKQRLDREPTGCAFDRVADAIADAEQRGSAAKLASVVAWLRGLSAPGHRSIHDDIADALERGEDVAKEVTGA